MTWRGRLDLPDGPPQAYALFAHCFTCGKDIYSASRIARGLTDHGIAVLRFDFTGLGSSEGEFANTDFSSNVEDLLLAARYLRERDEGPKILIGHSLGGAAVLAVAGEVEEAVAVATIVAPSDPSHVAHLFAESRAEIEEKGETAVAIAGRTFRVRRKFLEDIEAQPKKARIAGLRKALMIFHAPLDQIVGIDNASEIFIAAKHPKNFIVPGQDRSRAVGQERCRLRGGCLGGLVGALSGPLPSQPPPQTVARRTKKP
jgi:putative redox protein